MPQTNLDPFSAQIVALIRNKMSDEQIVTLVANHLRAGGALPLATPGKKPNAVVLKAKSNGKPAQRRSSARKAALKATVEQLVLSAPGAVRLSELAAATGASKPRVQAALKQLKKAGTIAVAGDRGSTRYAADLATATRASRGG